MHGAGHSCLLDKECHILLQLAAHPGRKSDRERLIWVGKVIDIDPVIGFRFGFHQLGKEIPDSSPSPGSGHPGHIYIKTAFLDFKTEPECPLCPVLPDNLFGGFHGLGSGTQPDLPRKRPGTLQSVKL